MAIDLRLYLSSNLQMDLYDDILQVDAEWVPETAEGDDPVTENIPLYAVGTNSEITQAIRDVNRLLERARAFTTDDSRREAVWLRLTPENDILQQSLVYDGRLVKGRIEGVDFSTHGSGVNPYTLVLKRHAAWEETTLNNNGGSVGDISSYGGTVVFTGTDGDMPARIWRATAMAATGAGFEPTDFWIGFKPMPIGDEGDESDFVPLLREAGAAYTTIIDTADTSAINDSNRSSVAYIRCSFSTDPTLQPRTWTDLDHPVAGDAIYQGRYLLLMAARVSASGTRVGVQLKVGYSGMGTNWDDYVPLTPEVEITSTTWDIIALGYIQLPPFFPVGDADFDFPSLNLRFAMWAERLAGSGYVDWDDIILLPVEHAAFVNNAPGSGAIHIIGRPDDKFWQYGGTWLSPEYPGALSVKSFGLPTRNCIMVVVADQDGYSENLNVDELDFDLSLYWYTRWRNYAS